MCQGGLLLRFVPRMPENVFQTQALVAETKPLGNVQDQDPAASAACCPMHERLQHQNAGAYVMRISADLMALERACVGIVVSICACCERSRARVPLRSRNPWPFLTKLGGDSNVQRL